VSNRLPIIDGILWLQDAVINEKPEACPKITCELSASASYLLFNMNSINLHWHDKNVFVANVYIGPWAGIPITTDSLATATLP
jgi:hypothetical protein